MADITPGAVVLRTPYSILQNFNFERPFTLTIKAANGGVRDWPTGTRLTSSVFVYDGDTILFQLNAPVVREYVCFDYYQVNPSTGITTLTQSMVLTQPQAMLSTAVILDATTWIPRLSGNTPIIIIQPTDQSGAATNTIRFTVSASGPSLAYRWRQNGALLSNNPTGNGSFRGGATLSTFFLTNAQIADSCSASAGFDCRITAGGSGNITFSNRVGLTVT